ncbi:MAG: sensor histidine kinase [Clostridiaceae bacterium]|jgi:two-component system sensor histidine kinase YesM|nr:sensor histidine kinase [Clostridiaceae bacterium]
MNKKNRTFISEFIRNLPIQKKLLFSFIILTVIPALLIGILSFYRSSELLKHKTEQYMKDILLETGNNIETKLSEVESLSFQIVSNSVIHDSLLKSNKGFTDEKEKIYTERAIDSQLRSMLPSVPGIAAIQVLSNDGTSYYINPASIPLSAMSLNDADKKILEDGKGSIHWFDTDPNTQTIAMGRTINSVANQERIGYALIYIREKSIIDAFKDTELLRNGEIFVVGKNGNIISCIEKELLGQRNEFTTLEELEYINPRSFGTSKIDGMNYYFLYGEINGTNWRMISFIPAVEYEKEIIWLRNWITLIIIVCCLLSVAFSVAISGGVSKPVRDLSKMMREIGDGDFSVYSTYDSKDEIGVLSRHFNEMVSQVKNLIQKVYEEELLKQKAELKSLRMQINPHFLYNSLESINWMARIRGVPEIGKMVKALGDLMRASISGDDFVTVGEEIKNIENYLIIQKFRYGDKIEVNIDIKPGIEKHKIPKLILQPIVENAIVHGIEKMVGSGIINISGAVSGNNIILKVTDNGLGINEDRIKTILSAPEHAGRTNGHTNIGLRNVDRRIKIYYGEEYGVQIQSREGRGTTVTLSFPIE